MYYDISWPLTAKTTEYKDRTLLNIKQTKVFAKDQARQTHISMDVHTGTHVDAPSHFLEDGLSTDKIPLTSLIGECYVADLTNVDVITPKELAGLPLESTRVLLKTKSSFLSPEEPFNWHFTYLSKEGAQYLVEQEVICLGIDYLSIERDQPDHPTHKILFEQHIPIIEGLRLADIEEGFYTLICLPLSIDAEASPARAILATKELIERSF